VRWVEALDVGGQVHVGGVPSDLNAPPETFLFYVYTKRSEPFS
jgi:hypothetical protein